MNDPYNEARERWTSASAAARAAAHRLHDALAEARAQYHATVRRLNQELAVVQRRGTADFRDYVLQEIELQAPGTLQIMRTADDEAEVARALDKVGYVRPDGRLSRFGRTLWKHARASAPPAEASPPSYGVAVPDFLADALTALGGPVVAVQLEGADSDDAESFAFYGVLRRGGDPCLVEFPQVRRWIRDDPAPIDAREEYALRASQGGAEGRCWLARARVRAVPDLAATLKPR